MRALFLLLVLFVLAEGASRSQLPIGRKKILCVLDFEGSIDALVFIIHCFVCCDNFLSEIFFYLFFIFYFFFQPILIGSFSPLPFRSSQNAAMSWWSQRHESTEKR